MPHSLQENEMIASKSSSVTSPFMLSRQQKGVVGRIWVGLLWNEWQAHGKLLLLLTAVWLFAVWMLPTFAHIGWLLFFGVILALITGPILAGNDVLEGCEEYCFSLPITRNESYLFRALLGTTLIIIFTILDILALGLDMYQAINLLLIDTGLVQPTAAIQPRLLYGLVLAN